MSKPVFKLHDRVSSTGLRQSSRRHPPFHRGVRDLPFLRMDVCRLLCRMVDVRSDRHADQARTLEFGPQCSRVPLFCRIVMFPVLIVARTD
jgi:hypothetical protein